MLKRNRVLPAQGRGAGHLTLQQYPCSKGIAGMHGLHAFALREGETPLGNPGVPSGVCGPFSSIPKPQDSRQERIQSRRDNPMRKLQHRLRALCRRSCTPAQHHLQDLCERSTTCQLCCMQPYHGCASGTPQDATPRTNNMRPRATCAWVMAQLLLHRVHAVVCCAVLCCLPQPCHASNTCRLLCCKSSHHTTPNTQHTAANASRGNCTWPLGHCCCKHTIC
jgi:hypothetical protein